MVKKIDLASPGHKEPFANPAPLGLLGLAVGCAALTPIALGYGLTPSGFLTSAILALFFGAGCQFLAGFMELRNGNGFGGVIFTLFSFLWAFNAAELYLASNGQIMDHSIKIALESAVLLILIPLTFGFGYFSKLMFYFLVDIDLLFVCKLIAAATHTTKLAMPIAILTILLGLLAVWIALATIINPLVGRQVFRVSGPIFFAPKSSFDFSTRRTVFQLLYTQWKSNAFSEMKWDDFLKSMKEALGDCEPTPEVYYLWEFGYVALTENEGKPASLRLTSAGIDIYEQLILGKYRL